MRVRPRPTQLDVARFAGVFTCGRFRRLEREEEGERASEPADRTAGSSRDPITGLCPQSGCAQSGQRAKPSARIGIEEEAEQRGYDLLLFTRAAAGGRRRQIYQDGVNRLQLADGAILLGRGENKEHLRRLLREGFRFVYVGRREVPGSPISYVAADYVGVTAEVVARLAAVGHRRIAYLGRPDITEAVADREVGYRSALTHLQIGPALLVAEQQHGDRLRRGRL